MIDFKKVVWLGIVALAAGVAVPQAAGARETEVARKITKRVEPLYPLIAKQARLSGTVRLAFVVTPDGAVKNVRTLGGNPVLATAAEEAIKQWKYEASKKESTESIAIRFVETQQ